MEHLVVEVVEAVLALEAGVILKDSQLEDEEVDKDSSNSDNNNIDISRIMVDNNSHKVAKMAKEVAEVMEDSEEVVGEVEDVATVETLADHLKISLRSHAHTKPRVVASHTKVKCVSITT